MYKLLWIFVVVQTTLAIPAVQHGHSPYSGQEQRAIKTLSEEEMQALLNGQGMGLAKAAELNHYPGPRHVLGLATQLQLSETQCTETQQVYDRMLEEAVRLGALIVDKERELGDLFSTGAVDVNNLHSIAQQIAQLQSDLRVVHLQALRRTPDIIATVNRV